MITAALRRTILAAVGLEEGDPLLRSGPVPGSYASSLPFRLTKPGQDPRAAAVVLADRLGRELWIAAAEATGTGFVTVTVSHATLARLAVRIANAGPACAESDVLRGRTVPAPPPAGPVSGVPGWPQARAALAGQLTVRLAATAGATLSSDPERTGFPARPGPRRRCPGCP